MRFLHALRLVEMTTIRLTISNLVTSTNAERSKRVE